MRTRLWLGALAVITAAVVAVLSRPAAWRVERSAVLPAAPAAVRAALVDPQRWAAWSPWAELAPSAQWTFGGPPSGRGASAYWASGPSDWRLTIIDGRDDAVAAELEQVGRGPWSYDLSFALGAEGPGTRVTWVATGEDDLVGKARALAWSHDRQLGPTLERGLQRLGALAGSAGQPFRVERTAQVAAAPAAVLARLLDLRGWSAWWPAAALRPGTTWTYGGPEGGVGASAYWLDPGAGARGRLTVVRAGDGRVELEREEEGPSAAASDHAISVAAEGAGTRVTWVVTGERPPAASGDRARIAEEALALEVEAGLSGLRRLLEPEAAPANPAVRSDAPARSGPGR